MTITPSDSQAAAIRQIKAWFEHRTDEQQVFRLFGYAGTGKSTVLKFALDDLGLDADDAEDVVTATFTGKAAMVLRRKGTPAQTIHSLIYSVQEAPEEEIAEAEKELAQMEREVLALVGWARTEAQSQCEARRQAIKELRRPQFRLNPDSAAAHAKLIVLDEVSMVGGDMAKDLLSYERPILVLGDPGQLPPIKGEGAFVDATPDVMLTEVHRQAAESAVIRLATWARQGRPIPMGLHDPLVAKMRFGDLSPEMCLNADQVICGRNDTRIMLNNGIRRVAGHTSLLPDPGEKIICLKNSKDMGVVNGMFLELDEAIDDAELIFKARLITEDGAVVGTPNRDGEAWVPVYKGPFLDHVQMDKDRNGRDWKLLRKVKPLEMVFGYAITCHKAQGSGWRNVIVWDDGLGRSDADRRRWLYTAITRAEEGLVLLS
ncbi:ATP-dependent DNA helicase [Roseospira visakhapatnamensis]|uniref:Exodeoxyribonuclease-5 n=1 Tax=Roseospira visakhapatnamensis TaxID=390880 RepID=A0A7W6RFS5_9PROT|nr:AAA family ATPase [Roseospira visakhapatnamensis]MBB4267713.1 exodeoxyribonuclease-5 [Roseospira visakhapatnamensis]